jgi:BNR repeat-like domain
MTTIVSATRRHARVIFAILAVAAAVPAGAAAHPYAVDLRQVSAPSPFAGGCPGSAFDSTMITGQETEPSITVNPANPRNIVGTWKQDVGPDSTRSDLIGSSLDGGRTWHRSTIPGLSKCTPGTADGGSDPWVSAGVDGTVYFSGLAPHFHGDTPHNAVVVSRSRNGGRTWTVPVTISPPDHEGNEMPAITASRRRPGRAYVVWADFATAAINFSTTADRGATWSRPVVVDPSIPDALDLVPRLVVLPNGTLVTVFARAEFAIGLGKIYAARSLDGGASWTAPVEVAAAPLAGFVDPETAEELPQPQFENVAVAPDGSVYVAVEASTSPSAGVLSVSRSRDGGASWTRVSSPGVGAYAFEPAIAVDSHGTVGITWYDLRNDRPGDGALSADVWFAGSRDRGTSWRESHVAGPTDLRTGALPRQNHVGEYQGLTAVGNGGFAAIFTLAAPFATDGPTDIFVARIARGGCQRAVGAERPVSVRDSALEAQLPERASPCS